MVCRAVERLYIVFWVSHLNPEMSKEALKKAPGFDKDDWPEMANRHGPRRCIMPLGNRLTGSGTRVAMRRQRAVTRPHKRQHNSKKNNRRTSVVSLCIDVSEGPFGWVTPRLKTRQKSVACHESDERYDWLLRRI